VIHDPVEGYMPLDGLEYLRQLATGRRVLEIGCWKGRTALAMAETAQVVYTVDHFRGDAYAGPHDTLDNFVTNWRDHPCRPQVVPIMGDFVDVLPALRLEVLDLLLYDGCHDYTPTADFFRLVLPHVRPDAVLVVDDHHGAYPQVMAAVRDSVALTPWRVEQVMNMAVLNR